MVPKGLLTFLGFLGYAEFSPWKRLPEFIELRVIYIKKKKKKKQDKAAGVFVTASDFLFLFCLEKKKKLFVLSPFG